MKKIIRYIILAALVITGIIFYSSYAFLDYEYDLILRPVKLNAEQIINENGYEANIRYGHQVTRLKKLKTVMLNVEYNDDLSGLRKLTSLENLSLYSLRNMEKCDLDSLPQMPNVKEFSLNSFWKKDMDCSALSRLENAESISSYNSNIWNWDFVKDLHGLKKIYIVMLYEYNEFKWDGLARATALEEFEASGIFYDRSLFESLEQVQTLKKVSISFTAVGSFEDEEYIEKWTERMESRGVETEVKKYIINEKKSSPSY